MGKKNIMISVDEDVHKKALKKGLNVSAVADSALYEKTIGHDVTIPAGEPICSFCGALEKKVNMKGRTLVDGMTWLWPDELWICSKCFKHKSELLKANKGAQ